MYSSDLKYLIVENGTSDFYKMFRKHFPKHFLMIVLLSKQVRYYSDIS